MLYYNQKQTVHTNWMNIQGWNLERRHDVFILQVDVVG